MKIKAIFLDMDETLCDTKGADQIARANWSDWLTSHHSSLGNIDQFVESYLQGIYKSNLGDYPMASAYIQDEGRFRVELIREISSHRGVALDLATATEMQRQFDDYRMSTFDFFPGVESVLTRLKERYTLVVITNGPIFSQHPKLAAVNMAKYVDHIIVGGEEPEQKPAKSIFEKALHLAGVEASEAIHVGDSLTADVAGANNVGITSVWISAENTLDSESVIKPSYSIADFTEIEETLTQVCC